MNFNFGENANSSPLSFIPFEEQYDGALLDASNVMPTFDSQLLLASAVPIDGSENQPPTGGWVWNNNNDSPSQPQVCQSDGPTGYNYPQYYCAEEVRQGAHIHMPMLGIPTQALAANTGYNYFEQPYYYGTETPQASGSRAVVGSTSTSTVPEPLAQVHAASEGEDWMYYVYLAYQSCNGELSQAFDKQEQRPLAAEAGLPNFQFERNEDHIYRQDLLTYETKTSMSTSTVPPFASTSISTAQHYHSSEYIVPYYPAREVLRPAPSVSRPPNHTRSSRKVATTLLSAPDTPLVPCQWDGGCGAMIPLDPGQAYDHVRESHLSKEEKAGSVQCKWANCRRTETIKCISLRRHLGSKGHLTKALVCPECRKKFASRVDALTRHRKGKCVKCKKAFGSCLKLEEHKDTCKARLNM